jgi:hypothetical protein
LTIRGYSTGRKIIQWTSFWAIFWVASRPNIFTGAIDPSVDVGVRAGCTASAECGGAGSAFTFVNVATDRGVFSGTGIRSVGWITGGEAAWGKRESFGLSFGLFASGFFVSRSRGFFFLFIFTSVSGGMESFGSGEGFCDVDFCGECEEGKAQKSQKE